MSSGSRAELAGFLKYKRAALKPSTPDPQRRVPGLKRGEVADRAGISADWYARLEQGRSVTASVKTMDAISGALQLSKLEQTYVRTLARTGEPREEIAPAQVSESTRQLLAEMVATPAFAMSDRWDMVDWNEASRVLYGDIHQMPPRERNCLWQHFADSRYNKMLADKEKVLPYIAALFRYTTAEEADLEWRSRLIKEVSDTSRAFSTIWNNFEVADWGESLKYFDHPQLGNLTFTNVSHRVGKMSGESLRVVTYFPDVESGTRDLLLSL